MQVHRNLQQLPAFRRSVITAGTFDGVHAGHQQLIERIVQLARNSGGESVLITFEPHPRLILEPDNQHLRLLSTLEEKIKLLSRFPIDHLVVVPFHRDFATLSAQDYIREFLVGHFHPEKIVIGYNHHFGHHRDGNFELLVQMGPAAGYEVIEIPRQLVDTIEVSSTRIRIALEEGDLEQANHLLGHPYILTGLVTKGRKLGRTIVFPTANLQPFSDRKLTGKPGVYAVRVKGDDFQRDGMMNIGYRPTINGTGLTIEVNLFDFADSLYGQTLEVAWISRLRDEKKFESLEALTTQLGRDEAMARHILLG